MGNHFEKKKKKVAGSHRRTHLTCPDERLWLILRSTHIRFRMICWCENSKIPSNFAELFFKKEYCKNIRIFISIKQSVNFNILRKYAFIFCSRKTTNVEWKMLWQVYGLMLLNVIGMRSRLITWKFLTSLWTNVIYSTSLI